MQHISQHRVLLGRLLICRNQRAVADENVQILALHHTGALLLQLVLRQMNQQVSHAENRVSGVLTNHNIHHRAVLLHHCAVQRQRYGHPLVFFDTAVIVSIQKGQLAVLKQGVLLNIQPRGIYMRPQNLHTGSRPQLADTKQRHRLLHAHGINLISCLQLHAFGRQLCHVTVTCGLSLPHDLLNTLALGLAHA